MAAQNDRGGGGGSGADGAGGRGVVLPQRWIQFLAQSARQLQFYPKSCREIIDRSFAQVKNRDEQKLLMKSQFIPSYVASFSALT
jgi:hypothetical protein